MTERRPAESTGSTNARKGWSKPRLRSVVPARQTRGGPISPGPLESLVYRVS